jgi:hypothetical protein
VLPILRRQPSRCERLLADIQRDRQASDQAIKRSVAYVPNIWIFDPRPYRCDNQGCYIDGDGTLLYGDMSHLSLAGSQIIGVPLSNLAEKLTSGSGLLESKSQ